MSLKNKNQNWGPHVAIVETIHLEIFIYGPILLRIDKKNLLDTVPL